MGKQEQQTQTQQQDPQSKKKSIQKSHPKPPTNQSKPSNQPIETISLLQQPRAHSIREFVYMPNVQFYLNKMSSSPNGTFIDLMHKHWWGDYRTLEVNHSYIQWLFPNSFQSRFNQVAKPLTKEEARHFRENLHIAKRFVHSYEMILEFFGMKLRNRVTGEVTRTIVPRFKDRYDQTLLSAYHNHLRVTRILCSMTEVGFAFYARQWCKFLKKQIYEHNGRLIRLKHMDVYKHWRPYQIDQKQRSNKIDVQDVPNIYLRELWKQQGYNPLVKERSKWSQVYDRNKATIILEDQSDDEKVETKLTPGRNQSKNEQKQQQRQLSIKEKAKTQYRPQTKPRKIQLTQKDSQIQPSETFQSSQEFSLEQDQVEQKQYGRRGSKQHQKLRRELATSQNAAEKERFLRLIRKQEQYEKKLEMHIKSKLSQDNDNYVKRQMSELRTKFNDKLKEFRQKGPKVAETMEEREKRMMQKGKPQQEGEQDQ